MKKLIVLVVIVALTVFAAQMVMAQKGVNLPEYISSLFLKNGQTSNTQQKEQNQVLGETDVPTQEEPSNITSVQSIKQKIDPVISSVSQTIEDVVAKTSGMLTGKEQKIEVDKAVEDLQKKAEKIPEDVLNKAKYEYCKQVVSDYEKR